MTLLLAVTLAVVAVTSTLLLVRQWWRLRRTDYGRMSDDWWPKGPR